MKLSFYRSTGTDAYENLAIERYLTETVGEGEVILYLWQNRNTVVIGKNQNARRECRTAMLHRDGGTLARRLSGGGAVYHDLGNLNFTFSARDESYSLPRQQSVIVSACRALGIEAILTGRNDILADGRKFSGNSFYSHAGRRFHNGTLLLSADLDALTKYLAPSKLKLAGKGVASARSRVVNLKELNPSITVDSMSRALQTAFESEYGETVRVLTGDDFDRDVIARYRAAFSGYEWVYGRDPEFEISLESRFPWGEIVLRFAVRGGCVGDAAVYTDAMDPSFAQPLEAALLGAEFRAEALSERVKTVTECAPYAEDIIGMLRTETER